MDLRLVIELATAEDVTREWDAHLSCGGAFVRGASVEPNTHCQLVLNGPNGELELPARVVFRSAEGIGLELCELSSHRPRLEAWREEQRATTAEPGDTDGDHGSADPVVRNVYERLRHLTLVQQLKVAKEGEVHERMALERLYGKTVWEALLRNPRVTHPEVARIARMGTLPRPMLELITGNTAWLRSPEIRRALLSNLRLSADQIPRVLRLLPKHELRLVPNQTAYPSPVREAARRMLKELEKERT